MYMVNIAKNITELTGHTPLPESTGVEKAHGLPVQILAEPEYFNPGRSVKDRIGPALIGDAGWKGLPNRNSVIIEPASGNTGITIAPVAAAKGYRTILTMPDTGERNPSTLPFNQPTQ
jgi:cysteine synthase A